MKKRDFNILKETISPENVLAMSELIAIMEIRFQIGYVGTRAQNEYFIKMRQRYRAIYG